MKGEHIGELEELILLIVANLYDNAYGVAIREELIRVGRKATISTVHNVLQRLQEKGFMDARYSDPTPERGGKRKLLFRVNKAGQEVLSESRRMREALWNGIPAIVFDKP
jgi:DNA-binding PadR family transcriptional regulator